MALAGLGFLTLGGGGLVGTFGGLNVGDVWVLGTALAYALFLVYLGEVAHRFEPLMLASAQH